MKSFKIAACIAAALTAMAADAGAAGQGAIGPRYPLARHSGRPLVASSRLSARALAPAYSNHGRRLGFRRYGALVGGFDAYPYGYGDLRSGDGAGGTENRPMVDMGDPGAIVTTDTRGDYAEHYVDGNGTRVVRTNPGPRIITISAPLSKGLRPMPSTAIRVMGSARP